MLSGNDGFAYQISGAILVNALDINFRNKFLRDIAEGKNRNEISKIFQWESRWFETFS